MNLADYLSDLLGQLDEVSVPGLGNFMRTRVNSAYDESEGRFYPPYHQVAFVAKPKDDNVFAQYVADEKNISLASSKYFVEKFVNKLREEAMGGKYLFADLGSFLSDDGQQLIFKPNERVPADPAFYGYPTVDVFKIGQPLSVEYRKPVFEAGGASVVQLRPEPVVPGSGMPAPRRVIQQPDYYDDDTDGKKGLSIWLLLLVIAFVLATSALSLYNYDPSLFDGITNKFHKHQVTPPVIRRPVKKDTVKKVTPPVVDSTAKTDTAAKKDTTRAPLPSRFEAIAEETSRPKLANERVSHLKKLGYDAYIIDDAPGMGPLIKISVGSYTTYAAADSVINSLVNKRVIQKHHIPLEIKSQ